MQSFRLITFLMMLALFLSTPLQAARYDYPGSFGPTIRWNAGFSLANEVPGVGDFNGDGLDDVATFARSASEVYVALNLGNGSFNGGAFWSASFSGTNQVPLVGDFNGDGRADVVTFNLLAGSASVALSNGVNGFGATSMWKASDVAYTGETPYVGDFNGDHRDDVAVRSGAAMYVFLSTGSAFGPLATWQTDIRSGVVQVGDVNGDGRADVVCFARNSRVGTEYGDVEVATSNGLNAFTYGVPRWWHQFFAVTTNDDPLLADLNGDGAKDIIAVNQDGRVFAAISTGNDSFGTEAGGLNTVLPTWQWHSAMRQPGEIPLVGKFNRDANADLAVFVRDLRTGADFGATYVSLCAAHAVAEPDTKLADFGYGTAGNAQPAGNYPLLVLVSQVLGQTRGRTDAQLEQAVFGPGQPNIVDWYREMSHGNINLTKAGFKSYGPLDLSTFPADHFRKHMEIVCDLDGPGGFEIKNFDTNGDGIVDAKEMRVLALATDPNGGGHLFTPDTTIFPDDPARRVRVLTMWAYSGESASLDNMAHELCHGFGMQDLYGWDGSRGKGVTLANAWTGNATESRVQHLDPWSKLRLGWVRPLIYDISQFPGGVFLPPVQNYASKPVLLYDSTRGTSEFHMVEHRNASYTAGTTTWTSSGGTWRVSPRDAFTAAGYDIDMMGDTRANNKGFLVWSIKTDAAHVAMNLPQIIYAGDNGVMNSVRSGDDVLSMALGGAGRIHPGPNGVLDTVRAGDDVAWLDALVLPQSNPNNIEARSAPQLHEFGNATSTLQYYNSDDSGVMVRAEHVAGNAGQFIEWGRNFRPFITQVTGITSPIRPGGSFTLQGELGQGDRFHAKLVYPSGNTTALTHVSWQGNTAQVILPADSLVTAGPARIMIFDGTSDEPSSNSFAVTVAAPVAPTVTTLAVSALTPTSVTLNGTINANSYITAVTFDYGLSLSSLTTGFPGAPASVVGSTAQAVSLNVSGLLPGTAYVFRVHGLNAGGGVPGGLLSFTTPVAPPTVITQEATAVTATCANLRGTVSANGANTTVVFDYGDTLPYASSISASPSAVTGDRIAVSAILTGLLVNHRYHYRVRGANSVANTDGEDLTFITMGDLNAVYNSASDVPADASSYTATGRMVNFTLNYAPTIGTTLTVVRNTGVSFIGGEFGNLTQGQVVTLTYGGTNYHFVANYFGGTGNDLVLQWADTRLVAWGDNLYGALGNNSTVESHVPTAVIGTGILTGKTVIAVAVGTSHSLALCSDGTVAAWGSNEFGQLGTDTATAYSLVPVGVIQTGALAGKRVVALTAGAAHTLALCSDGSMCAWGRNNQGQLGDGSGIDQRAPVAVFAGLALSEKTVTAIAAGSNHNLALCSDNTLVAWGANAYGQLGDNTTIEKINPSAVLRGTALDGKTITGIAAGGAYSLARCSDNTLAAWGDNYQGTLGNGTTDESPVPVLVDRTGVLAGKTIVGLGAGALTALALCSDNTVAFWGNAILDEDGFGPGGATPQALDRTGVLAGRSISSVAGGAFHSLVTCADGTLAAWGVNGDGQLGDNSLANHYPAVGVSSSSLALGERFLDAATHEGNHNVAIVAMPPNPVTGPPSATTLAATDISATSAKLQGLVIANRASTTVSFQYGKLLSYDHTITAVPATVTGSTPTSVIAVISGLEPGTTYHFQVIGLTGSGFGLGGDLTFTTLTYLQEWRKLQFGTTANAGDAADLADPESDGVSNLVEFAFDLSPLKSSVEQLPQLQNSGDQLAFVFTAPANREGITYGAEWSPSMAAGTWLPLADNGTGTLHSFKLSTIGLSRAFMRLTVTNPGP